MVGEAREVDGAIGDRPGPASVSLPEFLVAELVEHARREYPNEACGLIIGDRPAAEGGRPIRFVATRNAAGSPYRYEIDSKDLLRLTLDADELDQVFWAIVHSHVKSEARPSPTDIGLAFYPDALYILFSLAADGGTTPPSPPVRAWRIVDGQIYEVAIDTHEDPIEVTE